MNYLMMVGYIVGILLIVKSLFMIISFLGIEINQYANYGLWVVGLFIFWLILPNKSGQVFS